MNRQTGLDWISLSSLDDSRLVNEGAMAEQFVGQELMFDREGINPPELFYWHREEKSSNAEIDYVLSSGTLVVPVEVKAGKSGTMKSLLQFMLEKDLKLAVRFDLNHPEEMQVSHAPHNNEFTRLSLPLYLAGQLPRLLDEYRLVQVQQDP